LREGWTHTELKLTARGPVVIEVNGRLGGHVAMMLRSSARVGAVGLALDVAAGRQVTSRVQRHAAAYSYQIPPPVSAQRLVSYGDLAKLAVRPDDGSLMLMATPGGEVDWRQGTYGVLGMIDGKVPDARSLLSTVDEIATFAAREILCATEGGDRVPPPASSGGDRRRLETP
jgi:hypothetical protein